MGEAWVMFRLVYIESSASTPKNVSSPFCVLRPVMFRLLHVYRLFRGKSTEWCSMCGSRGIMGGSRFSDTAFPIAYRPWHARCSDNCLDADSRRTCIGLDNSFVPHKSYEVTSHAGWLRLRVGLATAIRGGRRQGTQLSQKSGIQPEPYSRARNSEWSFQECDERHLLI